MRALVRCAVVVALAGWPATPPMADEPETYQLTVPPGWTRATENGSLVLSPPGAEAAGARVIVLPPEPLDADFEAQAERGRFRVEQSLGLHDPRLAPLQRGSGEAGRHLAFIASYPSPHGDRYAGYFALASRDAFALAVFYASSFDAYTQLAPPATAVFGGLRIRIDGATLRRPGALPAPLPLPAPVAPPAPPPATPAGDLRARLVGTFTSFSPPADVRSPTWALLDAAGLGSFWQFRADGTYRYAFREAQGQTSRWGRVEDGRWTLAGDVLTLQALSRRDVSAFDQPAGPGATSSYEPVTYRVAFGPGGALRLTGDRGTTEVPAAR